MKIIVLISFLFTLACSTTEIAFSTTENFVQSDSLAYVDTDKKYTLDTIISAKKYFLLNEDSIDRFSNEVIWSYFTITNLSSIQQSLIVQNAIRLLRYADVLVIHEDGTKETFMIGTDRDHKFQGLGVVGYPLEIKPNERIEIYTKHKSIGFLNTHWNVSDETQYHYDKAVENSVFGVVFGVIFLVVIYGTILFYITSEKSNLYFNGIILSRVLLVLSLSGFFYTYSYDMGLFIRTTVTLNMPMVMFFESLFFISLYNLKQKSPNYYRIFSAISIVGIIFFLISIYNIFTSPSIIAIKSMMVYVAIATLASLIFTGYATYKGWKGSLALLISVLVFIYVRFSYMNAIDKNSEFILFLLIVVIVETLLILLALTFKVKEIYDEKVKAQIIILNHAKYLSLGKMHAATIHQLRTPIAHIGAIATRIKFVFERHKHQLDEEEYDSSNELEQIVSMANNTVSDLYNLYSTDQEKEYFDLKEAIHEILLLMNVKSENHAISIISSLESAPIFNYPNSIKHIIMIIIENAIDILQEREIKNPTINISLLKSETGYEINICDNGGGIMIKPIEDVFEMYNSHKKTKGLGIGLALAKDLSNFSDAQLDVFNTTDGVCFTVKL